MAEAARPHKLTPTEEAQAAYASKVKELEEKLADKRNPKNQDSVTDGLTD